MMNDLQLVRIPIFLQWLLQIPIPHYQYGVIFNKLEKLIYLILINFKMRIWNKT
jgi:hypothetical protein